jgi:hypothetical protein
MRILTPVKCALSVSAALAILTGCNGGAGSQIAPAGPIGDSSVAVAAHTGAASWMSPDAKGMDLLYVSDLNTGSVDVYSYPGAKLKGRLKGFAVPHGECVDKAGDVFITNGGVSQIVEYAHGGTTPIATLNDPHNFPHACSVDPTTGNLAVTSFPLGSGPGTVQIYKHAKGKPKSITVGNVFQVYFCGYDDKGNLFVDGTDMHVAFEFAELPAGSTAFMPITLNQSFTYPAGVQWDGTNLAVGDQVNLSGPSKIYEFSISGNTGTEVGSTSLANSCDVLGFWIQGGTVIAPNDCSPNVMYFNYPAGGSSTKTIGGKLSQPVGTVVSLKQ